MQKLLTIISIAAVLTLVTSQVNAQTCSSMISTTQNVNPGVVIQSGHYNVTNGFAHYAKLWCYTNTTYINKYWQAYGFVKSTWGNGYGNGEHCSASHKPFHRTLSAIRFIDYVSSINVKYSALTTWYSMSKNNIDTISANCTNGSKSARTDLFSNVYMYMKGFYKDINSNQYERDNTIGDLASLIIHESRHAWSWHNGDYCNSCDKAWNDSDVIKSEIRFLWDVHIKAPYRTNNNIPLSTPVNRNDPREYNLSEPQLDLMRDKGNYRLKYRFDTRPALFISTRWILTN